MDTAAVSAWISAFATTHPMLFVALVVPMVFALVNFGIWYFTSAKWAALLDTHPRVAAAFKLLDAVGVNPVKVLKWAYVLITGKQFDDSGNGGGKVAPEKPVGEVTPAEVKALDDLSVKRSRQPFLAAKPLRLVTSAALLGAMVAALAPLPACALFKGDAKTVTADACMVIDAASKACVLLNFVGADGKPKSVRVSQEELNVFGAHMSAKRAAEKQ